MKKYCSIVVIAILVLFLAGCSNEIKKQGTDVNIVSNLFFIGEISEGIQEFKFSLENIGKDTVKLEFPTYLEYNFSLGAADGQDMPDGVIKHEHPSLDRFANTNGRTITLEPQEKLEYQILLKYLPSGNYQLSIDSASGYGQPIYNKKFTVE